MPITFAEKIAILPRYEGGMDLERARREYAASDVVKLASNESPWGPAEPVLEAAREALDRVNRYPDQYASLLRSRIAARHDWDPAGVAVANGSCEILLAAALALCEPGAEIVYGWPAFSMYPQLAPLSGAREIRVPLRADYQHDLEAMAAEVTAATQLVCVCNPNNPTSTHIPVARISEFLGEIPERTTVILDEAYVEFQLDDDPDETVDLARRHPNVVVLRTFSKIYGLAGLRTGYGLCSPSLRSAFDAVRQPFSVNLVAQAAAAEALQHSDVVAERVERTIVERVRVVEGVRDLGLSSPDSHANFCWIDLGDRDEAAVVQALGERGVIVRPGTPLGGPGHIRVTFGTAAENAKFLDVLAEIT